MSKNNESKNVMLAGALILMLLILAALSGCMQGQVKVSDQRGVPSIGSSEISSSEWFTAIDVGSTEEVQRLLAAGANPDQLDKQGDAALHKAAQTGNIELARILLVHGANVNIRESEQGYTPLMYAGIRKDRDMIMLLLSHGADPMVADKEGYILYHYLAYRKDHESLRLLAGGSSLTFGLTNCDGLSVADVARLGQMQTMVAQVR